VISPSQRHEPDNTRHSQDSLTDINDRFQEESGWNGVPFHPDSAWKRSSKICMKLTSAECTVENSW